MQRADYAAASLTDLRAAILQDADLGGSQRLRHHFEVQIISWAFYGIPRSRYQPLETSALKVNLDHMIIH